jgi:hypothetical protein
MTPFNAADQRLVAEIGKMEASRLVSAPLTIETGQTQSETTTTRLVHEEQLPAMKAVGVAVPRLLAGAGPL